MSASRCALALRCLSSATKAKNPLNELQSVQADLVCLLFHKIVSEVRCVVYAGIG